MRKVWSKWLAVAVLLGVIASGSAKAQGSVSLQVFYDELQPYGTWIDHGRYGYVWMPNAGADFVPYGSNGYWVQTTYGNTWVSNYSWGWAPFHYGRWFYDDFYGWVWVPDTTWGPAWVTWRSGGGYYGWAPLMPGLSISMTAGYYNNIPGHYWNFVPYRYVMYRQVYRHCLPRPRAATVINHTTVIVNNNYYGDDNNSHRRDRRDGRPEYFTGPSRTEIENRSGERIPMYEVHDRNAPGRSEVSRSSVSLYKPNVESDTRRQALPSQFTRDNEQERENISEMRSRQSTESRRESLNDNRDAIRRSPYPGNDNESSLERALRRAEPSEREPRDIDDLRRNQRSNEAGERELRNEAERSNNRRDALDRAAGRDADFSNFQRERASEEQRRQQREAEMRQRSQQEDRMQRFREQREVQQRTQERQVQESDLRRRSLESSPRQSTDRQPSQFQQQRTPAPSRQQQYAPRQSTQPRMSSPQNRGSSGSQFQQRSTQRTNRPVRD